MLQMHLLTNKILCNFHHHRYKEHDDGLLRLQTVRYESIELTQQLLAEKEQAHKPAAEGGQSCRGTEPDSEQGEYHLQKEGRVAEVLSLILSKVNTTYRRRAELQRY